jgi:hypothetical protein
LAPEQAFLLDIEGLEGLHGFEGLKKTLYMAELRCMRV